MAATPYSLRYLANKIAYDDRIFDTVVPFTSNLEKAGRAMRYAIKTVQYYRREYNYPEVVAENNKRVKDEFNSLENDD